MMGDIDLMIPEEQLIEARNLLLAKGYYHEDPSKVAIDLDKLQQAGHIHITELFHPTGYGYLELHRIANYESYHPDLIRNCYSNTSVRQLTVDSCTFYSFSNEYLYLYNQAHHYYEHLKRSIFPYLDLRSMIEQAMLLDGFKSGELLEIHNLIRRLDPAFLTPFFLQNALISDLFLYPIEDKYRQLDSKKSNEFRYARLILLRDSQTVWRQKFKFIISMIYYIVVKLFDPRWRKERIFNLDWYKSKGAVFAEKLKS